METDTQRLTRFHADFQKLKNNREKVPLQQLTTRYARSYNTLVAEVMDGAVWFYRKCVELEEDFPTTRRTQLEMSGWPSASLPSGRVKRSPVAWLTSFGWP